MLSGFCPARFVVRSTVWCSAADAHLKLLDVQSVVPVLSMSLLIVDPWQYCVCCIRSGAALCTLLMVCSSWTVGASSGYKRCSGRTSVHLIAAEPRSTAGPVFPSRCPSGTILLALYSMVWDWRVSRAEPMFFISLSCSIPTIV